MEFRVKPEGCVSARKLPGNDETLRKLSDLWVEEHVFAHLDQRIRTFYGAHKLFSLIELGHVRVYGAFDERDAFLGCVFGWAQEDTFITHCAFYRGVDAVAAFKIVTPVMVADFASLSIIIRRVVGYIPECNRAAIRAAKRYGCRDDGVAPDHVFIDGEYLIPCHRLIMELQG